MKTIIVKLFIIFVFLTNSACANQRDTIKLLDLFSDVFDKVKTDYVEEVDDKELIESAINGMLSSLDPHSSYLTEKDFYEMRIQTRGEFGGLGIEVTMENGLVKVVSPIDDTPAYRAGIESGDYISRIDEEPVMGTTLSEAVDKMRGKPGTKIILTVLREGKKDPLEFEIERDVIKIKSVKSKIIDDDIAYVRVTSFSERTARNIKQQLKKIERELGSKFKGLLLDLRNNPGGLLDESIEVSDLFIEKGEIVSTGGRLSDSNKSFTATKGDIVGGRPIVVLINSGSASASEIVSGALQDHKRAIVIGTKSFGKGSVQTVIPLSTSRGAMRLTTSRYYTPSGRSIQAEGIEPDIIVNQAKLEELKNNRITSEASLRKHLKNESNGEKNKDKEKEPKKISSNIKMEDSKDIYDKDYQLGRAIDLLRGVYIFEKNKSN